MPKNLYERNGVWYARFSTGGQLRRICLRTRDLRTARTRLKALQAQAADAEFGLREPHTWAEAVAGYVTGPLSSGAVKPSTARRYKVSLQQIDPYFVNKTLGQIDEPQIARFISARQGEGATNATIRRDLTTMSRVLAYARAQGMTASNAALAFDRTQIRERRAPIKAPTKEQIDYAASLVPAEWAALLHWLRGTGMRLGEALRARWADLDGEMLVIPETKSGKVRTIRIDAAPLPHRTRAARLFHQLPEDSTLTSSDWCHFRRKFADMPRFRLHDLRHAYAIGEIRKGRDIYDLSHHLGHSSVKVTEIYLGYTAGSRATSRHVGSTEHDTRQSVTGTKTASKKRGKPL